MSDSIGALRLTHSRHRERGTGDWAPRDFAWLGRRVRTGRNIFLCYCSAPSASLCLALASKTWGLPCYPKSWQPPCDTIKNKCLVLVPSSWRTAPKTLESLQSGESLLYANETTGGWRPLGNSRMGAGGQKDQGWMRGLERSAPPPPPGLELEFSHQGPII